MGTARSARSSAVLGRFRPRRGDTWRAPTQPRARFTLSAALVWLRYDVPGCSGNCIATAERTPPIPSASAMSRLAEPTQCPSAWTLGAPVTRRTSATAVGQSRWATSSRVNDVHAEGRSMLAR